MKIIPFILVLILVACSSNPTAVHPTKKNSIEVSYANHFDIIEHADYTEIQILQPESGKIDCSFALVKRNSTAKIPIGLTKIEVPVKRMAVLSTTHIGMLDALNQLDCIAGTTDAQYIANPTILKRIKKGKIAVFENESSINPSKLMANHINLVVYSGFGKAFPNAEKLNKLNIFTMPNYEWREEHPLGKAEWIKVFGYLIDKPKLANSYFKSVEKSYTSTQKSIATNTQKHPSVLVGSLIGGIWYAPAGESYMASILKDSGAEYVFKNEQGTGSCEHSIQEVFTLQKDISVWINPGATSKNDLEKQQQKYSLFHAFTEGEMYDYIHNSNYFWEMGAVNPHWILSDFAAILGTQDGQKLHFYAKLK